MNDTATKLSDAAWSKIEVLSALRRFIQQELDNADSLSPGFSTAKLKEAIVKIDFFSVAFSRFLAAKNTGTPPDSLEEKFDQLSDRYEALMISIENLPNL